MILVTLRGVGDCSPGAPGVVNTLQLLFDLFGCLHTLSDLDLLDNGISLYLRGRLRLRLSRLDCRLLWKLEGTLEHILGLKRIVSLSKLCLVHRVCILPILLLPLLRIFCHHCHGGQKGNIFLSNFKMNNF